MTEAQVTPTAPAFPWGSTPYDVDVSVNPYNRDVFIRTLISHVEELSRKVQALEARPGPPPKPIPTVTTPKPKPAAKGGGSK